MGDDTRDFLMDNIKGIMMFLVVFGHSLEPFKNEFIVPRIIYVFIYLFHMPVFVFISGYFSKNVEKGRKNAVKTFLVPFLLFNVVWNILTFVVGMADGVSILTPGWALWYLFSMFIWKILLPDMIKMRFVLAISIVFGIFSGALTEFGVFMSLSRTVSFLPFFLAGYFTDKKLLDKIQNCSKWLSGTLLACCIAIGVYMGTSGVFPTEVFWGDRAFTQFNIGLFSGFFIGALQYIVGFAFVVIVASLVPKKKVYALSKVGKNTLPIYILHTYLLLVVIVCAYYVEPWYIKLIISFVGSGLVIYALSGNRLNRHFANFIDKIIGIVTRKKGGKC